ncbi:hypothetical protein J2Y63_006517 [Shinella sp. BE166]
MRTPPVQSVAVAQKLLLRKPDCNDHLCIGQVSETR